MSKFYEEVKKFEKLQDRYAEFGAYDTEPSTEFQYMLRQLIRGDEPVIPVGVRGWQLFSEMKGNGLAARALTRQAEKVVAAGKQDHMGLMKYDREEMWRA